MPPRRARSTSRRNTPVSPPKRRTSATPTRQGTRQSTRSQSHELQHSDAAKLGETENFENPANFPSPRRRTRTNPRNQELPTVNEEDLEVTDLQQDDATNESEATDESELDQLIDDRDSDTVSMAGSTHTTHSLVQLNDLDRDAMVDALPDLYRDSVAILSVFQFEDPARLVDLHNELMSANSRPSKRLRNLLQVVKVSRDPFGVESHVNIRAAVRKIAGVTNWEEVTPGPWRPDAILQLANLAMFLVDMFTEDRTTSKAEALLTEHYHSFPKPYADLRKGPFSTKLSDETARLVLELRTQFLLSIVQARHDEENFDPGEATGLAFYDEENVLHPIDLSDEQSEIPMLFQTIFNDRALEISNTFQTKTFEVYMGELNARFPWSDFLAEVALWAQARWRELEANIEAQNGAESIQRRLESDNLLAEIEEVATQPHLPVPTVQKAPTEASQRSPRRPLAAANVSGPARLKTRLSDARERKARQAATAAKVAIAAVAIQEPAIMDDLPTSSQPMAEIPQSPDVHIPSMVVDDDDEIDQPPEHMQDGLSPTRSPQRSFPSPSQPVRMILDNIERQAVLSNKENIGPVRHYKPSFIDRQQTAQRVTFDSQDEEEVRRQNRNSKRISAEIEDDEDDDFEDDLRPTKSPRNKRTRRHEIRRPSTPNDYYGEEIDPDQHALDQQLAVESHRSVSNQLRSPLQERSRPRHPASPVLDRHPRPPQSDDYEPLISSQHKRINEVAKLRAQGLRHQKRPRPQTRRPFTEAETDRLIYLIEEHGTSWTRILYEDREHPHGSELQARTQVNLKDKARNLKMDFLKSNEPLPLNFTDIKLGSSLENKLRDLGVAIDED